MAKVTDKQKIASLKRILKNAKKTQHEALQKSTFFDINNITYQCFSDGYEIVLLKDSISSPELPVLTKNDENYYTYPNMQMIYNFFVKDLNYKTHVELANLKELKKVQNAQKKDSLLQPNCLKYVLREANENRRLDSNSKNVICLSTQKMINVMEALKLTECNFYSSGYNKEKNVCMPAVFFNDNGDVGMVMPIRELY